MGIRKLYRLYLDCYYRGLDELKAALSVHQMRDFGGYSSAGRALAWHARGQQFDPAYLHQLSPVRLEA